MISTANAQSSSSASWRGCCCWLCLLFSFLGLLILAIVLAVLLAVKPKKPQFDLQQVAVQYVGITANPSPAAAPSSASVSLNIRMDFTAVNDNKVGIKYGESRFTVMYRGIPLGRGTVPGFYQPAHSVRRVDTVVAVDRVNLLQADAADLVRDASLNDRVELKILGDVGAKIRILGFTSPEVQVSVDCAIVISPRKQSLTDKQCGFDGAATQGIAFHDEWPFAIHLLGHFYVDDINSARFLWKSIPSSIKESQPEVVAVWRIGQKLWMRDYVGVHEAIHGFSWSQEARDLVASFSGNGLVGEVSGADNVLEPRRSSRNVEVRELREEDFLSKQEMEEEGDEEYDFESDGKRVLEGYGEEELET
ncbi:late embryogenesis abundant (LEA) hydroxyproline-rich glycoprotein family [Actinidia rufa]|uniref:Late embryogenesis abundant (LEA) hydroxyproline-rich glycoprotein family n=1 Tax=Actinidia rufa TaxID=165716 RepID=A0A7J0ETK3_9ERIC|nr:late embryogenesis abundant (LEA) hydroxyproline-rich glycoprotein family [Actinidia rufa]